MSWWRDAGCVAGRRRGRTPRRRRARRREPLLPPVGISPRCGEGRHPSRFWRRRFGRRRFRKKDEYRVVYLYVYRTFITATGTVLTALHACSSLAHLACISRCSPDDTCAISCDSLTKSHHALCLSDWITNNAQDDVDNAGSKAEPEARLARKVCQLGCAGNRNSARAAARRLACRTLRERRRGFVSLSPRRRTSSQGRKWLPQPAARRWSSTPC